MEAATAGKRQLADQATANQSKPKIVKTVELRPEKWDRCPVCDAPAINPTTLLCEMPMCETQPPQQ